MLTVYSPEHRLHQGGSKTIDGRLVRAFEQPERAERVLEAVKGAGLGKAIAPRAFGLEPILRVHDEGFVAFLRDAHGLWQTKGKEGHALPYVFAGRDPHAPLPSHIDDKLGYYAFDASTPITAGTFQAAKAAVDVALTAQHF